MTTALQAQSNQRNAQQSTGPVTEAGRARSARNATRHGYYAADIVMAGEDQAQFERLLAGVQANWLPEAESECELTDEIAVALWRRRRLRRTEAEIWSERCAGPSGSSRERTASAAGASRERTAPTAEEPRTLGQAFAEDSESFGNAIEKLRRWWQGNERHLNRCQDKLALIKRLAGQLRKARPPEEVLERRRHAQREIDLHMGAPVPDEGELPVLLADPQAGAAPNEIGNSAEQSQSHNSESPEPVTAAPEAPALPVSQPAAPPALSRRERRALERQQAKARRQQERPARPGAAA